MFTPIGLISTCKREGINVQGVKGQIIDVTRLTHGEGQYFFGYYDVPAWNASQRYHLCHRVKFWKRIPEKDDIAEIGLIDMKKKEFIPVAETTAWNFQQGAMLQWNPLSPEDEIIFNVRDGEQYKGVILNIETKQKRMLDRPIANVDPTGRYGLSINFNRLFDFRPGYGYAGVKDPYFNENHPKADGVFLIDMKSGKSRLIISLDQIWEYTKNSFKGEDKKILINHITFNTDGTRFVFLVRNFPEDGKSWRTAILTANTDGSDMYVLSNYSYASHYHWRDKEHIVFHAKCAEGSSLGNQLYVLKDKTHEVEAIDPDFFLKDGHCSYSPDREWMLYDSYPDEENYRHLYLYNLKHKKGIELGQYYAYPDIPIDARCDLHPRWNSTGTAISFDSIHEGQRHVYYADLKSIMESIK